MARRGIAWELSRHPEARPKRLRFAPGVQQRLEARAAHAAARAALAGAYEDVSRPWLRLVRLTQRLERAEARREAATRRLARVRGDKV